jgi:hypothetical protein
MGPLGQFRDCLVHRQSGGKQPLGTDQAGAAVPLVVLSSRATASLFSPACRSFGASSAGIGGAD